MKGGEGVIGVVGDAASDDVRNDRRPINTGLESNDGPDSSGHDRRSVDVGDDDDEFSIADLDEHALSFHATSGELGDLGVDLSPWPPLLGLLDSIEPEESPGDELFTASEGVEGPHAIELRAESMLQYAERGAQRSGELDRTEVGLSDDNRDVVAGRDEVEVDGMLDEHTGHGLVVVADEVETNVGGPLTMRAHLEDNIIMAGVMRDEWSGGTFITAAMSDDMAAGVGLRCTAPFDVWAHGLVGMEERPGTCAADGVLSELAGTLYEREYGPSAHAALVARNSGTVVTTMKTGFRPLMKVALGVRNLIPGGGGGGSGDASASPPAAPPITDGGAGDTVGAVTLTAAESGGALGRGAAGSDDTDEIVSVVRTVESASSADDIEDLQHPASTADNLDDLARVEGEGYRQVAEIYDQPVPAADETSAAGQAARGPSRREPPALYSNDPGTAGYEFNDAYGSLHDRNSFYRRDLNMRGNLFTREYLSELDAKAIELLGGLGGKADDVAFDNYGLRTSSVYAALQEMAADAEKAGDLDRLADIRTAMDRLEGLVQDTLAQFAARTDEFQGTALGSQHVLDPNIDVDKLRNWLQDQLQATQQTMMDPQTPFEDLPRLSWTQDYYDQMLKALDMGTDPLAESSDQVAFIRTKLDGQAQVDVFLDLQDGLIGTLSDPEFFRSADEMGLDAFTPPVRDRIVAGEEFLGPDSLRPFADAMDEPDVHPIVDADIPPPPDQPVGDAHPGASPDDPGGTPSRPGPPELYDTRPGAEGYKFEDAHDSLHQQNLHYRNQFNYRGNFFMREYLKGLDAKAVELFEGLGNSAEAMQGDGFGHRAASVYAALEQMADEAREAGRLDDLADIRAAMDRLEAMVDDTLAEVALRADEFSGATPASPRSPIDRNIDTEMLRSWFEDRMQQAVERHAAAALDEPVASQLASWEQSYYLDMLKALDEDVNPLTVSSEKIAVSQINMADPNHVQNVEEFALYVRLQDLLMETLSNPQFHRSAGEMGDYSFTEAVRSRITAGLDYLGPDSLRPLAGGDTPPPLPAADFADSAGYLDEVRDRSFSRSALGASEETLERQAAGLAEGDAAIGSRAPDPGSATPEPSLGSRRTPPDSAQAPIIDHQSGQWVLEPYAGPDASPGPAQRTSTPMHGDAVPPQASDVSWESGLQASGDSEAGPATGFSGEADGSDPFRAPSEPGDVDPEAVDEVQLSPVADDDGSTFSSTAGPDATRGEDANPTGAIPDAGDGAGPGRPRTTLDIAPDTPDPVFSGTSGYGPGTDATQAGASAADADTGATRAHADLYGEPVSFEGRSLEGATPSDDPKELAQPIEGAEIPAGDLPRFEPDPAEPARKSILGNSDGTPVPDAYEDPGDLEIGRRVEQAQYNKRVFNDSTIADDSVWRDAMWSGDRMDVAARREANARWSEFAAAQRTSAASFSDDLRHRMYHVEPEATAHLGTRGGNLNLHRGADPATTVDRAHTARYIPGPRGLEAAHESGFGRLSQGWNQFPYSHRERILNTLQKGEALGPDQIGALESGLEGYRAAGGELSSSQYRAMIDMISDLGDQYRHARWNTHGEDAERLLQLVEMLDCAVVV